MASKYEPPKTHNLSDEEKEYVESLNPKERALHNMAIKGLTSSYFVWKSHGFIKWKESKKSSTSSSSS
jgi:hypothetical protein